MRIIDLDYYPVQPELLTVEDETTMAFLALGVIGMYIYTRIQRKRRPTLSTESDLAGDYTPRDVLMQPKKPLDEFEVPFKNFSLDLFHILAALVLFVIYCCILFIYP